MYLFEEFRIRNYPRLFDSINVPGGSIEYDEIFYSLRSIFFTDLKLKKYKEGDRYRVINRAIIERNSGRIFYYDVRHEPHYKTYRKAFMLGFCGRTTLRTIKFDENILLAGGIIMRKSDKKILAIIVNDETLPDRRKVKGRDMTLLIDNTFEKDHLKFFRQFKKNVIDYFLESEMPVIFTHGLNDLFVETIEFPKFSSVRELKEFKEKIINDLMTENASKQKPIGGEEVGTTGDTITSENPFYRAV
jgi:hypothetical protein